MNYFEIFRAVATCCMLKATCDTSIQYKVVGPTSHKWSKKSRERWGYSPSYPVSKAIYRGPITLRAHLVRFAGRKISELRSEHEEAVEKLGGSKTFVPLTWNFIGEIMFFPLFCIKSDRHIIHMFGEIMLPWISSQYCCHCCDIT